MNIREYIQEKSILFDGATGTYLQSLSGNPDFLSENANIEHPEMVLKAHQDYIDAGCTAIKTNTFSVNRMNFHGDVEHTKASVRQAVALGKKAIGNQEVFLFCDMGPIYSDEASINLFQEYKLLVDAFLEAGGENFLFETLESLDGICEIAKYIKSQKEETYVIVSCAVYPDGFTTEGILAADILKELAACSEVDAYGFNCSCSPRHMKHLIETNDLSQKPFFAAPNAGYPVMVKNHAFYDTDPVYFAEQMEELYKLGPRFIGGCCGTTPVHLEKVNERVLKKGKMYAAQNPAKMQPKQTLKALEEKSPFFEKLRQGEKVIAVELDSPKNAEASKFMQGAKVLKKAGADIITIADCPIARARMDSCLLACKIKRELKMDAMPHMTCRDRNLNAMKALILGVYAEDIRNVLLVTGDPIPTADRDLIKTVYQFNSGKLAVFVNGLNQSELSGGLHLFGALNINAVNFSKELKRAQEKAKKGMIGFLTQPVLSKQAAENLKLAYETLDAYILGGIMPVVSEQNALFMDREVNGITLDPEIIEMYKGKNREEGEETAIALSLRIMEKVESYVHGFYMITPFGRTGLISKILSAWKDLKA